MFSNLPLPKLGHEVLAEGFSKMLDRMMKQRELQNEAEYRNATLDLSRQNASGLNNYRNIMAGISQQKVDNQKSALDAKNKNKGEAPTNAFITQNQKTIQSIDNTIPQIKQLMESGFPGQLIGKYLHPSKQASYESKSSSITDSLISALGLPKTNESIELTKKMIEEKPFENRDSYKKRMQGLIDDLNERRNRHTSVLETGRAYENNQKPTNSNNNNSNNIGTLLMRKKNKKTGKMEYFNVPQDAEHQRQAAEQGLTYGD